MPVPESEYLKVSLVLVCKYIGKISDKFGIVFKIS